MLWDTWKKENIISVGWDIGDVTSLEWNEARDLIQEVYESSPGRVVGPFSVHSRAIFFRLSCGFYVKYG